MQARTEPTLVHRAKSWLISLPSRLKLERMSKTMQQPKVDVSTSASKPTVLVFGASGRLGTAVVQALERDGKGVRAIVRDGKSQGFGFGAHVDVLDGIDLADGDWHARGETMFQGIEQIVWAAGPQRGPGGSTSESIDFLAVKDCVSLAQEHLDELREVLVPLVKMDCEADLMQWDRLDDVIMGGSSSSKWDWSLATRDSKNNCGAAAWSGILITEGGGFCGTRTGVLAIRADGYDGIALRVRGDGRRYKVNVKTGANADRPESTYQAAFSTVVGEWTDVRLPWETFVPVRKSRVDASLPPLDPSFIHSVGLVMSKFEFNGMQSGNKAGKFLLELSGGIQAYRASKPQFVYVSSAGVERNALVTEEERKNEMPIVQLNPGGVLNWKYKGEMAVRESGLAYTVIRPTGLTEEQEEPYLLEFHQGDKTMGRISRGEVARVIVAALNSPAAVSKTFELRRGEATDARGKITSEMDMYGLFSSLVTDINRPTHGILPLPSPTDPPPPPSPERMQEILNDPRVQARMQADKASTKETSTQ